MHACWSGLVHDVQKVILIKNKEAFSIFPQFFFHELRLTQGETDSKVVLYCIYAAQQGYKYARARSPDSDMLLILLYYAREIDDTIFFKTDHGDTERLIDITRLSKHYKEQMCEALRSCHAPNCCDSVSYLQNIGKVESPKLLHKSHAHCDAPSIYK